MRRVLSPALSAVGLIGFTLLLLRFPAQSTQAARDGVTLCADLILPSLFPFFVLSSLFIELGLAVIPGRFLRRVMGPLFGLSGPCAAPLLLGAVGGYPVGIRTAASLVREGQCSPTELRRLSAFCNNCGPAFLFSVAGVGVFSSSKAGFLLLGTHLTAAFLVGVGFHLFDRATPPPPPRKGNGVTFPSFSSVFPDCVRNAFSSTLNVCAFVILFSVLIALAESAGLLQGAEHLLAGIFPQAPPALFRSLLIGVFEISTGVCSLQEAATYPLALPVAAFLLGWGGFSVHCQSLPYLHESKADLKPYFIGKFLQGILAALLTGAVLPFLSLSTNSAVEAMATLSPSFSLLKQESLALWALAGLFFVFTRKKGWK